LLIKEGYPKFSIFSDSAQKQMIGLQLGSCLLRYDPKSIDDKSTRKDNIFAQSLKTILILPFFRAHVSASLLLDKAERKSLYYRLTGEGIEKFSGVEKENQVESNA
jgi:tRNA (cytosine34-C5)-methyltransferase